MERKPAAKGKTGENEKAEQPVVAGEPEGHRCVLGSLVCVVHHPGGLSGLDRHIEGALNELGSHMVGHGPPDNRPRAQVQDGRHSLG